MPNVLITGAASGLGLEFLRAYTTALSNTHNPNSNDYNANANTNDNEAHSTIYAIDRAPIPLSSLFSSKSPAQAQIHTIALDISSPTAITTLFTTTLHNVPLDLVIHSAGIRGLVNSGLDVHSYSDVRNMETLEIMNAETLRRTWEVNVLGTFEVLRACVPGLRLAAGTSTDNSPPPDANILQTKSTEENPIRIPKVIVLSSRLGSLSHNTTSPTHPNPAAGGAYAYRSSKAALNAIVRSLAVDVPEAIWTVVHPGRVETGLVRVKEDGAMSVRESVAEMVALIEGLGRGESGRFLDRFGGDVPW
jgi:NAD(P)-dependent dehydrogenase (short-subunit alcohol dehydrogenase family)